MTAPPFLPRTCSTTMNLRRRRTRSGPFFPMQILFTGDCVVLNTVYRPSVFRHRAPSPISTSVTRPTNLVRITSNFQAGRARRRRWFMSRSKPILDFLKKRLAEALSEEAGCFDFLVQLQVSDKHMPIEDPSVIWSEADSPFVPVARIRDPRAVVDWRCAIAVL